MIPIEPAELSALIDGELSARRADAVRQAIAADPELRGEYERLKDLDAVWRNAADRAAFQPNSSLSRVLLRNRMRLLLAIVLLLIWRIAIKLLPFPAAIALEVAGLTVGLWWGAGRLLRASAADRWALPGSEVGRS